MRQRRVYKYITVCRTSRAWSRTAERHGCRSRSRPAVIDR